MPRADVASSRAPNPAAVQRSVDQSRDDEAPNVIRRLPVGAPAPHPVPGPVGAATPESATAVSAAPVRAAPVRVTPVSAQRASATPVSAQRASATAADATPVGVTAADGASPGRRDPIAPVAPQAFSTATSPPGSHDKAPHTFPVVSRSTEQAAARVVSAVASPARPGKRLVVLPPVAGGSRPASAEASTTSPSPSASTPSSMTIVESPRPMSFQRMFEHSANPPAQTDPLPTAGAADDRGAATTITFGPPVVQRAPESSDAPPADSSASGAAAAPAVAAAAAPQNPSGAAPVNIDELVERIYDPLAARLRTELWLDRERAGALLDLQR